eukprot:CAMPEP_0179112012 /NCGR_PEP_ID=MMETSP0796-20121207/52342_1 /TAXON_ID=73915 /ORGANISM="Pyrodinium bahamense, Strain pbaha01" /LENGTH=93 /DNA_ID=CAMNT_0020810173 /DNA_START=90 /DNA_END=370 /DNA_ORIENTATION=-
MHRQWVGSGKDPLRVASPRGAATAGANQQGAQKSEPYRYLKPPLPRAQYDQPFACARAAATWSRGAPPRPAAAAGQRRAAPQPAQAPTAAAQG